MGYRVSDNFAFAFSCGRTVFMDKERNRYFALPPEVDRAFQALVADGGLEADRQQRLEPLIRTAILFWTEGHMVTPAPMSPVACALESDPRASGSPWLVARCALSHIRAVQRTRRTPLLEIVSTIEAWRRDRGPFLRRADSRGWQRLTRSFRPILAMQARPDQCLANSVAFLDVATSHGLDAQIVFGVHAMPFAAHCWVQREGTVLNDALETVRHFSPIISI
jgi:hypothetical protein